MIAPVIVVLHEARQGALEFPRAKVLLELDDVLHRPMVAFDPAFVMGGLLHCRKVSLTSRPYVVHIGLTPHTVLVEGLLLLPSTVFAQTGGTIAGTVRDGTGAILPGVTVEASSPALIEGARAAVTDGQGNYTIVDLRPGTYTVSFTLSGFSTVNREGLELTSGFTANVEVEMRVGGVEETITVTGASPVVDIQNVRQQQVLSRELWNDLPTGKSLRAMVSLTLGATMSANSQDVGGTKGDNTGGSFSYHGAGRNDSTINIDGMAFSRQAAGGGPWTRTTHQNDYAFQETTMASDISAKQENAGVVINLIPREGGNIWSGTFSLNGSDGRFQSDNITSELEARGVPVQGEVTKLYDAGGGIGGPIMKERFWFFASERWWNAANLVPGTFFNSTPEPAFGPIPIYTPDLSRSGESGTPHHDTSVRLTFQVTDAQKISFFGEMQSSCSCFRGISASRAPEAGQNLESPWGSIQVYQGTWTYAQGTNWLFTVGNSSFIATSRTATSRAEGTALDAFPVEDIDAGFTYNAAGDDPFPFGSCCTPFDDGNIEGFGYTHDQKFAVTYVTGSHTFEVGVRTQQHGSRPGTASYNDTVFGPVAIEVHGGTDGAPIVPAGILSLINPLGPASASTNTGARSTRLTAFYAQEQWVLDNVTLNLGVRCDGMNGTYDTYTTIPSTYLPSQTLEGVKNSPDWHDIAPRLGAAYDLFGNGQTAIKASFGRYVVHQTNVGASPASRLGYGGGTRSWDDANGDFFPDCDLGNPQANGECGRVPNVNRGLASAVSTFYDPDYITGWGNRPFMWRTNVSLQHQLLPGVGVTVSYYHTVNDNVIVTDDRALEPSDYDPYCVTAPTDSRLRSVSGQELCGLFDLNPAKLGLRDRNVTHASAFGDPTRVHDGVDISLNARFAAAGGATLQGGVSTGRDVADNYFTVDQPFRPSYCRDVLPWGAGTQVKLYGSYPLPWWQLQLSGTFQNLPSREIEARRTYRSSEVIGLGRGLSRRFARVALIPPNEQFEQRFTQADIRLTKVFQINQLRAKAQFDVYNMFSSSAVLRSQTTYGSRWLNVRDVLGARLLKFGVQLDY